MFFIKAVVTFFTSFPQPDISLKHCCKLFFQDGNMFLSMRSTNVKVYDVKSNHGFILFLMTSICMLQFCN
jgi:hypothetical protein